MIIFSIKKPNFRSKQQYVPEKTTVLLFSFSLCFLNSAKTHLKQCFLGIGSGDIEFASELEQIFHIACAQTLGDFPLFFVKSQYLMRLSLEMQILDLDFCSCVFSCV